MTISPDYGLAGRGGDSRTSLSPTPVYGRLYDALYYGLTLPLYGLVYGLVTVVGGLFYVIYTILTIGRGTPKSKQQNKPDMWPVLAVMIFPVTTIVWLMKALGRSSSSPCYPAPPPTSRSHPGSRDCWRLLRLLTRSSSRSARSS